MALITLTIDNKNYSLEVSATESLLDVLKKRLQIGHSVYRKTGICGNCNVLVDGVLLQVCKTLAVAVVGKKINTAAGTSINAVHPMSQANCMGKCLTF